MVRVLGRGGLRRVLLMEECRGWTKDVFMHRGGGRGGRSGGPTPPGQTTLPPNPKPKNMSSGGKMKC